MGILYAQVVQLEIICQQVVYAHPALAPSQTVSIAPLMEAQFLAKPVHLIIV